MRLPLLLAAALIFAPTASFAADAAKGPCRDDKGKFIKCAAAKPPAKCRDIKTKKFAKCSAPNTEPVP